MALTLEEKKTILLETAKGTSRRETAAIVGVHRNTVQTHVNENRETIAKHQNEYIAAALEARIAVLKRLKSEIDKAGSKIDGAKVLSVLDASVERDHKMRVGFYISPEKLELALELIAGKIQSTCSDCPRMVDLAQGIQVLELPE